MSANTTPIFAITPKSTKAVIAAVNTARDGSGTLTTLFTAGANGARVDYISFISAQATPATAAAKVFRIFLTDTSGANPWLFKEVAAAGVTASATLSGQTALVTEFIPLEAGQSIMVSQSVYGSAADQTHVTARGGQY